MLRSAFSSLLLVTVLSAPGAFAQQTSKKTAKPAANTQPAPMEAAAAPAPANDGFGAPAGRVADAPAPQSEGFSIAPGFTAAPSRRVNTDYRGRALTPYVRRNVREAVPVAAPMPAPEPVIAEPTPVAEPVAASASATKKSSGAAATTTTKKATTTPKKAPAKKAPANDGWGSGGSGW
ncbi:ribonuclease E [Hymenobacter daecheongensis DSM 21074]|uniref:Ribonuclease E n=1 Tax=Hymenobacter daecheongensis DSM 21074 TaxID=1121955 RepID=A0A1M6J509_9BACT|nr:hypothetical protein [Hymenobacter daecheongensis]SHJ41722.1 ribonuclease E [Hymenobacter daecheongensis DSM 21074]